MISPEKNRETPIQAFTEKGRPGINFRSLVDREMARVMQAFGNGWPTRVEVLLLAEEGQQYTYQFKRENSNVEQRVTGVVPVGQVYIQVRSEARDLTEFWTTVREIREAPRP